MPRRVELDPSMRTRLCELRNTAKWSYARIHDAYPHIPIPTIKTTVRREKERIDNKTRLRSGRPRKMKADNLPIADDVTDHMYGTYDYS